MLTNVDQISIYREWKKNFIRMKYDSFSYDMFQSINLH